MAYLIDTSILGRLANASPWAAAWGCVTEQLP